MTIEVFGKTTDSYTIRIINNWGEIAKSYSFNGVKGKYNVEDLAAGIYLIEIRNAKNNEWVNTSKLIKK